MAANSRGVERVLAKCEACINAGNYYEAHQMFRTIYFRYKGQSKFTEAADILYQGALTLLGHNQFSSGADLSLLLIDILSLSMSPVTSGTIDRIGVLFQKMDPECPERDPYLSQAIKWSCKVNKDHRRGHPDLHQRFAFIFRHERNYAQARYHYVHSADGEGCAHMLLEFHTNQGFPSEVDLFVTQAVLQYLCLRNKSTANMCFETYTQKHPSIHSGPPYSLPLLNFIWLLLIALEGGKLAVFTVLCEKYQVSLNRDPSYREYLDQIGQQFFGVPPKQRTPQGLFGGLLQSMLGSIGSEDDDEDSVASGSGNTPSSHTSGNFRLPNTMSPGGSSNTSPIRKTTKTEKTLDLD